MHSVESGTVHGKTTVEWHTSTYGWHTSTYEWHKDDIRVHTSDIGITSEHIRATYELQTDGILVTNGWQMNDIRVKYEWYTSDITMTCDSKER